MEDQRSRRQCDDRSKGRKGIGAGEGFEDATLMALRWERSQKSRNARNTALKIKMELE